jgi:hypothetical protein
MGSRQYSFRYPRDLSPDVSWQALDWNLMGSLPPRRVVEVAIFKSNVFMNDTGMGETHD